MKPREARRLRDKLLIAGIVIMLATYIYEPLLVIGTIVAFSCLIPDLLYNKCPHCGKHPGRSEGAFCPHCGGKID